MGGFLSSKNIAEWTYKQLQIPKFYFLKDEHLRMYTLEL